MQSDTTRWRMQSDLTHCELSATYDFAPWHVRVVCKLAMHSVHLAQLDRDHLRLVDAKRRSLGRAAWLALLVLLAARTRTQQAPKTTSTTNCPYRRLPWHPTPTHQDRKKGIRIKLRVTSRLTLPWQSQNEPTVAQTRLVQRDSNARSVHESFFIFLLRLSASDSSEEL